MSVKFQDYYETLGVSRTATQDEIQKAYRKLARKYHPDVNKEAGAEDKFKALSEAYEVLKNPETRGRYDALGANWKAGQDFQPPPGWEQMFAGMGAMGGPQGGRTFRFETGGGPGAGGAGFSDFFETLFGGSLFSDAGGPGKRQQRSKPGSRQPEPSSDLHTEIELTLAEAFHGTKKNIVLSKPGSFLRSGTSKTLQVKVPAGVTDGSTIRLRGQAENGGDIYLKIKIHPDSNFVLSGRDVRTFVPLSPWEAVLGCSAVVSTIDGAVNVKIPAGSQTGKQLRLKGKGLPNKSGAPGDMIVEMRVVVPTQVSDEEKELFEKLQKVSTFQPRSAKETAHS